MTRTPEPNPEPRCRVSVIIPAFNEAGRIVSTLTGLLPHLRGLVSSFEIIIVDDGSTDGTSEAVLGVGGACIRLIRLEQNRGKGAALRRGVREAHGDFVFFADADLPYSLDFFDRALKLLEEGNEAVIGARDLPGSSLDTSFPRRRVWIGKTFSHLVNLILPVGVFDTQCGFKGFRRLALAPALLFSHTDDYTLDIELLLLFRVWKMAVVRIPVRLERHHGSKVRLVRDSARMLLSVLSIAWQRYRGSYPASRLSDEMDSAACPVCRGERFRIYALIGGLYRFCRCRQCGTIYENPRLPSSRLSAQYHQEYFQSSSVYSGYPDYNSTRTHQRETARWLWERIEETTTRNIKTVLDVGCGSGEFLQEARNRGKEGWGNDVSTAFRSEDFHFIDGDFIQAQLPSRYFDVVVFNDSFEHFEDPGPLLDRCRTLLRPEGRLMINTPDPDSWLAWLSGRSWISLKHEHLVIYPRKVIKDLLRSHGFSLASLRPSVQHVNWSYVHPRVSSSWPVLAPLSRTLGRLLGGREFRVPTGGMLLFATLIDTD